MLFCDVWPAEQVETDSEPQVNLLSSLWCKTETVDFPQAWTGKQQKPESIVTGQFYWDTDDRLSNSHSFIYILICTEGQSHF